MDIHGILHTFILFIPAMVANGSATLISHGTPLDKGKFFIDGKRILGDGKTIEGIITGTYYGLSFALLLALLSDNILFLIWGLSSCIGALLGDIIGSFIKRRIGVKRGGRMPLLDQLDFAMGATLFLYLADARLTIVGVITSYLVIYFLHVYTNKLAFKLGIKSVPW